MLAAEPGTLPSTEGAESGWIRITEALDLDVAGGRWKCNRCRHDLGSVAANYKEACLLADRDPREIHQSFDGNPEYSFCPDSDWCSVVEIYCPGCGGLMDVEYLPPGHPITHDVQLDLDRLRQAP